MNFTVKPPDPHGFDSDGDGVGCESLAPVSVRVLPQAVFVPLTEGVGQREQTAGGAALTLSPRRGCMWLILTGKDPRRVATLITLITSVRLRKELLDLQQLRYNQ
jgi:hypothetical protein